TRMLLGVSRSGPRGSWPWSRFVMIPVPWSSSGDGASAPATILASPDAWLGPGQAYDHGGPDSRGGRVADGGAALLGALAPEGHADARGERPAASSVVHDGDFDRLLRNGVDLHGDACPPGVLPRIGDPFHHDPVEQDDVRRPSRVSHDGLVRDPGRARQLD